MDNLNVKLKFHEHKNKQLEEGLREMLTQEVDQRVSVVREVLRGELLKNQRPSDAHADRFRAIEEALAATQAQVMIIKQQP